MDMVNITGTITNATEELFLAEIEPHQYGFNQTEFNFVTPLTIVDGNFNIEVGRFIQKSDHDYDRLYSRWVIVKKTGENTYEYASSAKWAGDISAIALNNIEEDKASSIKGLDGLGPSTLSNFSDLTDLDIKSMKLNLLLNGVLSLNPTGLTHEFNGKIYNISPGFVTGFDQRIKRLTDNGIKAAFVLLIPLNIGNEDLRRIFVHPDASLGLYSMANVATEEGAEYYAAVVDFLAERYSRPDKLYGRLDQWIIHNEVDALKYTTAPCVWCIIPLENTTLPQKFLGLLPSIGIVLQVAVPILNPKTFLMFWYAYLIKRKILNGALVGIHTQPICLILKYGMMPL